MDPRIETVTNEWRFRSCEPGYAGLNALAEAGFSGSVTAEGATGFMVNGRLVGIAGGTIESFWSSDIAALEADEPAQALLCAMLISDESVEAEYYTGETPISTVHETLASGSFSGYLELSENVFSGDYFIIYHGGTTKSVALLGTEERVITGDEAFERASDEVGIYEVKSVSIEVISIPEPEVDDSANGITAVDSEDADESTPTESPIDSTKTDDPATNESSETPTSAATGTGSPIESEPVAAPTQAGQAGGEVSSEDGVDRDIAALAEAARGGEAATVARSGKDSVATTDEWVMIPALDPAETTESDPSDEPEPDQQPDASSSPTESAADPEPEADDGEVSELAAELDAANRENERLRERIAELEARIAELEDESGGDDLTPVEAIGGTNLFVRYATKGRNTLEAAITGEADREQIEQNLQLERHTQFETDDLSVSGEPYSDFLRGSLEYRFISWLLTEMLFDLRDAGQERSFEAMVEIFPEVDRIEFHGTVPVHTEEGGDRRSEQYTFDVVCRDSMGAALLVANVHDDRTPVGESPVADLLASANTVASARPSLAGAFFVTRSYFEPEAMETVADATSGGLLRGSSRDSYVSVSRKHGFHLCLVEARDSSFHLNVPD